MFGASLSHITAEALVPEQLVHYARAVSGRRALLCGGHVAYAREGHAVLVAYPQDASVAPVPLADALDELKKSCARVTVLAPFRALEAPDDAPSARDEYWQLPVPPPPATQKLRNMLNRAARDVTVTNEAWSAEHQALVRRYLETRPLNPGTRAVFSSIERYVAPGAHTPDPERGSVLLASARMKNSRLAAFSVGDFSGLSTAFYMFAFRHEHAPPGSADLLLDHLLRQATAMGHSRMNLGLAINNGIGFFKKKWRAQPFLPCVETSWTFESAIKSTAPPNFFGRISAFFKKES
jgi:hypothetical protein